MNKSLLLPIIAVLLVSGCVIPNGGGPINTQVTKGVVIETFEPDFSEVYSGQDIRFRLRLKNNGEITATDVKAQLEGIPDSWDVTTGECDLNDLSGKEDNIEGGEDSCEFVVRAKYQANQEATFTPIARVTYKYQTSTTSILTIVNIDEARRLSDAGKGLNYQTREATTSSPVDIKIKTTTPIKVFSNSFDFPIQIDLQNADGTLCYPDCSVPANYDKLNYQLNWGSKLSPTNTLGCVGSGEIKLFRGKDNTIVCRLQAQNVVTTEESILQLTAQYGYLIQKSTSIKVIGRAEN